MVVTGRPDGNPASIADGIERPIWFIDNLYPLVKYDSHSNLVSPHLVYILVRDFPDVIFEYAYAQLSEESMFFHFRH